MSTNPTHITATTVPTLPPTSSVGLAVGLSLFFILLGVLAGVLIYLKRSKLRNILQLLRGNVQNKDDHNQTPQTESHQNTCMITVQPDGQAPIYENLTAKASNQDRSPGEHEEDLYLRCDSPDDAIYSNDAECTLAMLPDNKGEEEEEDLYIVPDGL